MFNLDTADMMIRKAAAMNGIKSGKIEYISTGPIVAKVYNKNFPDGVEISEAEAKQTKHYTWSEIAKSI